VATLGPRSAYLAIRFSSSVHLLISPFHQHNMLLPQLSSWLAKHGIVGTFLSILPPPALSSPPSTCSLVGILHFPLGQAGRRQVTKPRSRTAAGQIGSSRRRRDSAIHRASGRGANICITKGHISALLTGTEMGRAAAVAEFGEPPVRGASANIPPT
jgi:hypothetical protein